ncbi:MAG TPA: DUF3667 domain-containing protein [Flavobacteriaceae bacterium]|nr:DUF3667 domain-containing protein [Flavobacteriaceae bacterium]
METTATISCKNCEKIFDASYSFCPYCSQEAGDNLTLKVLFHNTISNYFCVDARFFKSFVPLMFKPGLLPKRFVNGKRMLYLHPAQFYLFVSVVFFFLFSFVISKQEQEMSQIWNSAFDSNKAQMVESKNIPTGNASEKSPENTVDVGNGNVIDIGESKSELDSLIAINAPEEQILKSMGYAEGDSNFKHRLYSQGLKVYKRRGSGMLQGFYNSIPIATFILLPIFALFLKLFYFRKGRFAHHLVFAFYFFSFMFIVFSLLLIAGFIWPTIPGWIVSLILFSTFFYLWFGVKRFYEQKLLVSYFKSAAISFLFLMLVIPLSIAVMGFATFLFY